MGAVVAEKLRYGQETRVLGQVLGADLAWTETDLRWFQTDSGVPEAGL